MSELRLYDLMDRAGIRNYRTKVMLMAFVGTHIPLIALVSYFALKSSADWTAFFATVGVTLAATLVGTALTLLVLNHLLRPILLTSRTLRSYARSREIGVLPTGYTDEVGTLMADTAETLKHLERVRDGLEYRDATTGLPNRRKLVAELEATMPGESFTACVIRFTNHRRLIETLDIKAAEAAIAVIADRLSLALGDQILYRGGSAEFVWLSRNDGVAVNTPDTGAADARVKAMIARCAGTLTLDTVVIEPVLHGGIAVYPNDAEEPETVIDHAMAAVALASDAMPVSLHSSMARRSSIERLRLEQELRRALDRDEFVLHYQPVIDLSVGRAVGAEALIRWQHPEKGMIPPANFIGLAESTGLIDPMGLWVMRKACMQVHDWNASGLPGMKVAINLSARQFLDGNLIGHVTEALEMSGISADQLEIELTETAAMADHAYTKAMFSKLRDLGVSIAIDDFGTGYASMSYLRKLPFDKLKIDREFVANVHRTRDSQAICGALVTLGKGLGLRVLAEGAESHDEVIYLWSHGCDLYQGYYFSKPLAPERFIDGLQSVARSTLALVRAQPSQPAAMSSLSLAS